MANVIYNKQNLALRPNTRAHVVTGRSDLTPWRRHFSAAAILKSALIASDLITRPN
jgi:hypothetical protein